jgi:cyclopropane fatty-acyl-phospholipid synthase-like methyltransferase
MSDQESAATEPRWTSEAAEKWLSRVDGLERSGAPIRELLLERAGFQPGEQVLHVGCGSGPSAAAAARAVHPGGRVTAIAIAAPMIAAARSRRNALRAEDSFRRHRRSTRCRGLEHVVEGVPGRCQCRDHSAL